MTAAQIQDTGGAKRTMTAAEKLEIREAIGITADATAAAAAAASAESAKVSAEAGAAAAASTAESVAATLAAAVSSATASAASSASAAAGSATAAATSASAAGAKAGEAVGSATAAASSAETASAKAAESSGSAAAAAASAATAAAASTAAAIATTLEGAATGDPAALARIQYSVSGGPLLRGKYGLPNRECKIYFDGRDLAAYTARPAASGGGTVTPATDGTITEALDTANGNAGGTILTLVKGADATKNVVVSPYFFPPVLDDLNSWFVTEEIKLPAGGWCTYALQTDAAQNLAFITIGLPDGQIKVQPTGGTTLTVTKATSGFEMTDWCRFLIVVTPTSAGAGDIRTYVYSSAGRFYIGKTSYVSNNIVTRVRFEQKNNGANTMYKARQIIGKVSGVLIGCSLEAGYFGYNMSPSIPRASNNYQVTRNPASLFASMYNGSHTLHGSADWIINSAFGGYTVAQMLSDFQNWVLGVKPSFVMIGSATNSVMSALSSPDEVAYMTQAKADYKSMIDQAAVLGIPVFATGITPRHETLVVSLGIDRFITLAKDWNTWLKLQGIPVYDPWVDFEDPAIPGQLNPAFDGGDHLHFNKYAQRMMAQRQHEVWIGA